MLCTHCRNMEPDGYPAPDGAAGRTGNGNWSAPIGMRCERCAASIGPDLATALRRKTGQLQQFGLADADGFILEPMISSGDWERPDSSPCERGEHDESHRER